jgi:hypothetical protein
MDGSGTEPDLSDDEVIALLIADVSGRDLAVFATAEGGKHPIRSGFSAESSHLLN